MTYSLTLATDEYTLRGEIYERSDGKGWEYRLYYSERKSRVGLRKYGERYDWDNTRAWDSAVRDSPTDNIHIVKRELIHALSVSGMTIEKRFTP